MTTATMNGATLLQESLRHVESASIKEWAITDHNRPLFEKLAQNAIDAKGQSANPIRFAAFIVCQAIGL